MNNYKQSTARIEQGREQDYLEISSVATGKVLDFGCNNMLLKKYLNPKCKYFGYDVIKQDGIDETKFLTLKELKKRKFDTIVFCHVIEHLSNPIDTVKQLYENNLTKDGIIIIIVPNILSTKRCIASLIGYPIVADSEHIQAYSYGELIVFAKKITTKNFFFRVYPFISKEIISMVIIK